MTFARLLVLAVLYLLAAAAVPTIAADRLPNEALTVKQASIGFGGKFKAGHWQPVHLTLAAGQAGAHGELELLISDGDQTPVVYRDSERGRLSLQPHEEQTITLYAKAGPANARLAAQLRADQEVVWSAELAGVSPPLSSTQEFIVGIGPPVGLEEAVAGIRRRGNLQPAAAVATLPADLPDRWWGYEGVDTIVLATSDRAFLDSLGEDRRRAIVEWAALGGRIVLCVGARGEEIAAAGGPLAELLPGEVSEVTALRERSGLESFTKAELPFDQEEFQRRRPYITHLKNVRGEVLVEEVSGATGRPLAVHAPLGLGEVTFLGLDLDHPSLREWKGRTRLLTSLLDRGTADHEPTDRETRKSVTHFGYDDLTGQLRAALDQFPSVTLVNFTTVAVLCGFYLLLVAPGDYLLLSRLGWRRHLTWVTFPLLVAAMLALAVWLGLQAHGSRLLVSQAEIVDIDVSRGQVRGSVWTHVYSPATRKYDLQLAIAAPPGVADSPAGWLSWQGLPGDSLSGLESRQIALTHQESYAADQPGRRRSIEGLTVEIASSKSLSGCWWGPTNLNIESKLTVDRFGMLAGEFRQPLPLPLRECLLAYGEKLYRLGTLTPGQTVRLADWPPLNLEARLTERRVEQSKDVSTPWERNSTDIPRIVQMLMFHEAARGRAYTGLTHRYQPQIDLSEHVRLGRAVLVGRASEPVASVVRRDHSPLAEAGDTATWTWYRIVFPVPVRTAASESASAGQ